MALGLDRGCKFIIIYCLQNECFLPPHTRCFVKIKIRQRWLTRGWSSILQSQTHRVTSTNQAHFGTPALQADYMLVHPLTLPGQNISSLRACRKCVDYFQDLLTFRVQRTCAHRLLLAECIRFIAPKATPQREQRVS